MSGSIRDLRWARHSRVHVRLHPGPQVSASSPRTRPATSGTSHLACMSHFWNRKMALTTTNHVHLNLKPDDMPRLRINITSWIFQLCLQYIKYYIQLLKLGEKYRVLKGTLRMNIYLAHHALPSRLSEVILMCDESACTPSIVANGQQAQGEFVCRWMLVCQIQCSY